MDNTSIRQYFSSDVINAIKEKKTPCWLGLVKIQFKTGGEENVFAIAKPIIGFDTGHYLGIVVLYMKEKDLASMYLDNINNKNDKFYIIDENRTIISTQDKSELYGIFDENKYLGDYRIEEISDVQSIVRSIDNIQTLIKPGFRQT